MAARVLLKQFYPIHAYTTMYFIITIPVIALIAWIVYHKRTNTVTFNGQKMDKANRKLLDAHVNYYHKLGRGAKKRFEARVLQFLSIANIEGVGTEITDLDRMLIASSAVIPIFGLGDWMYQNLTNIVLYPDTFDSEFQFEGENRSILGMVGSGFMNGQMLLSRTALLKGFSVNSGKENTAIHEFVHLLDKSDGATDGVPELLMDNEYTAPWLSLMHREMHRIKDGKSDINPYALTNDAEFLAVASEYFFEKPEKFQQMHPELYEQLILIFRQNQVAGK
jgi:Mlc titration factor MtfA (ptsG expression regulator)